MTFAEYSESVKGFIPKDLFKHKEHMLLHSVFGMNSETGEVAGIIQKTYQNRKIEEEHLMKEIGDVLWFLNEAAISLGFESLDAIAELNITKLTARYHGKEYNANGDLHRVEGDV